MADQGREGGGLDIERIMTEIRQRAAAFRGEEVAETPIRFQEAGDLDEAIARELHQASVVARPAEVEYSIGWRTPILGQLWALVRRRLHQEMRIYLGIQASRQYTFNSSIVRALGKLLEELGRLGLRDQQREVAQLRERVAELEERIRRLEGGER
ncbi:MAG: hypothetical protein HYX89_06825 [Chloroflexi bacterium]|nr:hypothetical protein [Chloroflexota bacterium]